MRKFLVLLFCLLASAVSAQEQFPTYVGGLTPAATLTGTEQLYILQNGFSRRITPLALLQSPLPLNVGFLPFVTVDTYTVGSANSNFLSVRGTQASPVTDGGAVAIFQATRNTSSSPSPTLYASLFRLSTAVVDQYAATFEAVDGAGIGGTGGLLTIASCATPSTGNCQGNTTVGTASGAYSTIFGTEGNAINSSGTNQTTTFSLSRYNAGFMATCGGTNTCDAGFLTNPLNTSKAISGFLVTAASVQDTAFRNDATIVNGVDLSRGTYSGNAFKSPGYTVGPTGAVTTGAVGVASGQQTFAGTTSGSFAVSASATGVPTMSTPWPVAAGGTGDTGTAWSAFTMSPTCGTATFTSSAGAFKTIGKTTFVSIDIVFNAIGSCTNNLTFSLPNTVATNGAVMGQVANGSPGGKGFTCALLGTSSTTSNCVHADGTNWNASEHALGGGVYQNQ